MLYLDIIPGVLVTPPCQGRAGPRRCGHFPTALCGRRWLCRHHAEEWSIRRHCIAARRRYNRAMRRIEK